MVGASGEYPAERSTQEEGDMVTSEDDGDDYDPEGASSDGGEEDGGGSGGGGEGAAASGGAGAGGAAIDGDLALALALQAQEEALGGGRRPSRARSTREVYTPQWGSGGTRKTKKQRERERKQREKEERRAEREAAREAKRAEREAARLARGSRSRSGGRTGGDDRWDAPYIPMREGTRLAGGARQATKGMYNEDTDSDADLMDSEEEAELREWEQSGYEYAAPEEEGDAVELVIAHRPGVEERQDIELEKAAGEYVDDGTSHPQLDDLRPPRNWKKAEFLVKWKGYSHMHNSWDSYATLEQLGGFKRVTNYMKRKESEVAEHAFMTEEELEAEAISAEMEANVMSDHKKVERIVSQREGEEGEEYLCKWVGLPYSECTWEHINNLGDFQDEIDEYNSRELDYDEQVCTVEGQRKLVNQARLGDAGAAGAAAGGSAKAKGKTAQLGITTQPAWLKFGQLRDYQKVGINWLCLAWAKDNNAILADEMGLGKTVQCVSMLGYLRHEQHIPGPFLVVVPLSTIPNWVREFRRWTPELSVITYIGDSTSRERIREEEWSIGRTRGQSGRKYKFHVLLTTYELVLKDKDYLKKVTWAYLMVDEAHRLKNEESALYIALRELTIKNKLLVTGTPLQNTLKELWALLHFLEPKKFPNIEEFEETYSMEDGEKLAKLHADMKPHMIRRVIKDVEKSLPPKIERVLRVEMSPMQKEQYRFILNRNYAELNKGVKGAGQASLLNIVMDLKKCCNHPFLFQGFRDKYGSQASSELLAACSGKLRLLDKLLARLKQEGHRVLIFSQMVRMLDLLSEYLKMRGYQHQRLDGGMRAEDRHNAMEHFNAPGSTDFAFLLSTRAGGLGINLATANTVVIFDSDWNPQNDLQAMSRAHRIGQKDAVNIYRLVTSNSVEESILERAKQKMVLDHLVIQKMDASGRTVVGGKSGKAQFSKEELQGVLRFGAEQLFKDRGGEDVQMKDVSGDGGGATGGGADAAAGGGEVDLDAIMARAEKVDQTAAIEGGGMSKAGQELMSAFQVSNFANEEDDKTFWSRLLDAPKEEKPPDTLAGSVLQPRRAAMKATENLHAMGNSAYGGDGGEDKGVGGSKPKGKREMAPSVKKLLGEAQTELLAWPKGAHTKLAWADAQRVANAIETFGLAVRVKQALAGDDGSDALSDVPVEDYAALIDALVEECDDACTVAAEQYDKALAEAAAKVAAEPPPEPTDGAEKSTEKKPDRIPGVVNFMGWPLMAERFSSRVRQLRALNAQVSRLEDPLKSFRVVQAVRAAWTPRWAKEVGWGHIMDAKLLLGVHWHGFNEWEKIRLDPRLDLADKMNPDVPAKDPRYRQPDRKQCSARAAALMDKLVSMGTGAGGGGGGGAAPEPRRPGGGGTAAPAAKGGKAGVAATGASKGKLPLTPLGGAVGGAGSGAGAGAPKAGNGAKGKAGSGAKGGVTKSGGVTAEDKAKQRRKEIKDMFADDIVTLRKLRLLNDTFEDMDKQVYVKKLKKYLALIGDVIEGRLLKGKRSTRDALRIEFWDFAASFQDNMDGEKMFAYYNKVKAALGQKPAGLQKPKPPQGGSGGTHAAPAAGGPPKKRSKLF